MAHSKIVQSASEHHRQVRKIIFGISQNIFHDARAFDPRNGMFNLDANLGHLAIARFLSDRQFLLARLFFG